MHIRSLFNINIFHGTFHLKMNLINTSRLQYNHWEHNGNNHFD